MELELTGREREHVFTPTEGQMALLNVHDPDECPGYHRPGTAREVYCCPGCGTRYRHGAGRWQRIPAGEA